MSVSVGCEHDEQFSMLMSMDLDGLLDDERKGQLRQHLATCPTCRAEWIAMQQVSAWLESSDMTGPPLGFAIRLERRLEERARNRRRALKGLVVLTGSLSLAGVTLVATAALVLVLVIWLWPGSQFMLQEGGFPVSQLTSRIALTGRGMILFLKEMFLHYGIPLLLVLGTGLTVLSVVWAWLFTRRPARAAVNGQ
jgi:hypothetical protein